MSICTCALQSGSNGNSIYVETPDARLLFDAGISGRKGQQRLSVHGRDIHTVDALIISHDHSDHLCGAGVFQRKFSLPLYITEGAYGAKQGRLGQLGDVRHFTGGDELCFGETVVETVPTAHDGIGGVAFVIGHGDKRLGIFTDLGHRFVGIEGWFADLDGVYIESNYDPAMLAGGPYPQWLKQRITGDGGHLSNGEAADLVRDSSGGRLRLAILAHLSEHNNRPDLALETAREIVPKRMGLALASRSSVSEMFEI